MQKIELKNKTVLITGSAGFNVEFPEIPLFSGGLHYREIIDLDLVASLRVGGIQLPALDI